MSNKNHFAFHAAVYLLIENDGKVFLIRRANTGFMDAYYTLVAGHVDGNESIFDAPVREAKEEADIHINKTNLEVIHVMHSFSNKEYILFFIKVIKYKGIPKNNENTKADDANWFDTENFPEKTLPFVKEFFKYFKKGVLFSEEKIKD